MLWRGPGLALAVFANCKDPAREDEFNRWYDTVHVPDVVRTPGVLNGQRYACVHQRYGEAQYIAVYELETSDFKKLDDDLRTMREQEAARGQWTTLLSAPLNGVYAPLGKEQRSVRAGGDTPKAVLVVATNCKDPARDAEYNRWYDAVHIPRVLRLPGVLSAQRYTCVHQRHGKGQYLAVYELDNGDFERLERDLQRNAQEETARGERSDLLDVVVSGVYQPVGKGQQRGGR